jgi:hypothetical protein
LKSIRFVSAGRGRPLTYIMQVTFTGKSRMNLSEFKPADSNARAKGRYDGKCNRTACLTRGARWFSSVEKAYYCKPCALEINVYSVAAGVAPLVERNFTSVCSYCDSVNGGHTMACTAINDFNGVLRRFEPPRAESATDIALKGCRQHGDHQCRYC